MTVVDLSARVLATDHNVFILHPGARKAFFMDFVTENAVFLDIPGFIMPSARPTTDRDLIARLAMASRIRDWHRARRHRAEKEEPPVPSRRIVDYEDTAKTATLSAHLGNFKYVYRKARKGDVIVCPGEGYRTPVLIGEFIDPPGITVAISVRRYPDEVIPARRVDWLSATRPKRLFSQNLIDLMQNRKAIISLYERDLRVEVYEQIYKNFILADGGYSRYLLRRSDTGLSGLIPALGLLRYFTAMYNAIDLGMDETFFMMDYDTATVKYYDDSLIRRLQLEVKSPGYVSLEGRRISLPAFIAVLLCVSSSTANLDEARNVQIVNDQTTDDDPCLIEVRDKYKSLMNSMGLEQWQKICYENSLAKSGAGLASQVEKLESDDD